MTSGFSPNVRTVNTTKPALLLTDLRPASTYNIEIFTRLSSDGKRSAEAASLHIRTKSPVKRPKAVTGLTAESGEFRSLKISWHLKQAATDPLEDKISHFLITLFRLNPFNESADAAQSTEIVQPQQITVPVSTTTPVSGFFEHTARNLLPDSFYQISVQAVTVNNVTGYPSVISSSPRVASKPPTASPKQLHVYSIGAHVATVSWKPPALEMRNGEIILYRLSISCDDWLQPRQIVVLDQLTQLIQGFTPSTSYQLTVSAATRGGNGPESSPVTFNTTDMENDADEEAKKHGDRAYHLSGGHRQNAPVNLPVKLPSTTTFQRYAGSIENLRCVSDENSLLLMWSPAIQPTSATSHDFKSDERLEVDHYLVKWGKLYPGPNVIKLAPNQTRFMIEDLDTDTPYLIDVTAVYKDDHVASAMVTCRTKHAQMQKQLLIPLNLHLVSSGPDWAVLEWDEPHCPETHERPPLETVCPRTGLMQTYQVAYRRTESDDGHLTERPYEEDEGVEAQVDDFWNNAAVDVSGILAPSLGPGDPADLHVINVSHAWVRLENLTPDQSYSAVVRAISVENASNIEKTYGNLLFSEWSLAERFDTTKLKPEDAPGDIRLTGITLGNGSSGLQASWQPPERPNGMLIGYLLYFTHNVQFHLSEWHKLKLPASSVNAVLSDLLQETFYFIRIRARNINGNGPLSSIYVFRTASAGGELGKEVLLDKAYYDPKSVLLQLAPTAGSHSTQFSGQKAGTAVEGNSEFRLSSNSWVFITIFSFLSLLIGVIIISTLFLRWRRQKTTTTAGYQPGLVNGLKVKAVEQPAFGGTAKSKNKERIPVLNTQHHASGNRMITGSTADRRKDPIPYTVATDSRTHSSNSASAATGAASLDQPYRKSQYLFEDTALVSVDSMNRLPSQTAIQTASGSSNSCTGSLDTPTRVVTNPTYQLHANPFRFSASAHPESIMANSYASATLGSAPRNKTVTIPTMSGPPMPLPFLNNTGVSSIMAQCYRSGEFPGESSVLNMTGPEHTGGGQMMPTHIAYNCQVQPVGMFYSADPTQHLTYTPVDQQFHGAPQATVSTPRVNAAELLSYTSLDDVRPVMSSSVHANEQLATVQPQAARDAHAAARQELQEQCGSKSTVRLVDLKQQRSPRHHPQVNPSSHPSERMLQGPENEHQMGYSKGHNVRVMHSNHENGCAERSNKVFSSEELSKEMENLEGLMKDLSAITRGEFGC
ncbi:unnamed protein product [Dicrocoelium dendriticum]|nr:unnamed protein product [Dicrocoelium dendriticum]